MVLSEEFLKEVSLIGSAEAASSFSKLSGEKVVVSILKVETVEADVLFQKIIQAEEGRPIVAYAQIINGIEGVSILAMSREESLNFIDLLNRKPIGTTGVLMDIDRSAIKETLNIISNSYMNALAKKSKEKIIVSSPHLIATTNLKELFYTIKKNDEEIVVLHTLLEISEHQVSASLYLIFNKELPGILEKIN